MKSPLNIKLDKIAHMPTRAHVSDAGLDLYAPYPATIPSHGYTVIDTGVHINIPEGYVGLILSRSSLMLKGLTTRGVVDSGYTGEIKVILFNHSDVPYIVHYDDKIAQLVIVPIVTPKLVLTEVFPDTDRSTNGFGSSGR